MHTHEAREITEHPVLRHVGRRRTSAWLAIGVVPILLLWAPDTVSSAPDPEPPPVLAERSRTTGMERRLVRAATQLPPVQLRS